MITAQPELLRLARSPLVYLLRQDENKQWRIYGWKEAGELEDTKE